MEPRSDGSRRCLALLGLALAVGCSGSSDAVYAPIYDPLEALPTTYQVDLSAVTRTVVATQGLGERLVKRLASGGRLDLGDGQIIQLTEIPKQSCPSSIPNCDEPDSAALGVGPSALVAPADQLRSTVRNQGQRGTCVAFSLAAAMDVLARRQAATFDGSEQDIYFIGKQIEGSWDRAGLVPTRVLRGLVEDQTALAAEESWPYNAETDCVAYKRAYPQATCSLTEAQGAGDDGRERDPRAQQQASWRVTEVHELYASLGRIKQALYRGHPVLLSINANSDFTVATAKQGTVSWVFKVAGCDGGICGHAVLAVGYVDDARVGGGGYLVVKNSWSEGWGDGGLAYGTYEWLENSLLDARAIVAIARN